MVTRAQGKAFSKGMVAALDREKDKVTTIIEISHSPNIAGQSLLKGVKHWLSASGAVDLSHTSIQLGDGHDEMASALQHSEKMRDHFRALYEQSQMELEMLKKQRGDTREWITITDMADRVNLHYTTIWRAHKAGRLVVKITGGTKKNQLLCDPATYVPAINIKKNQQ